MIHAKYGTLMQADQEDIELSQELARLLESFLAPLLVVREQYLDKRLVRTRVQCCVAIIGFRNNQGGLLLRELGSYLDGTPGLSKTAGTKRLGKLIRWVKWRLLHSEQFLLEEAGKEVEGLRAQGQRSLCILDGSVIEQTESTSLEGLAPVRSSKAQRTGRSGKGLLFNRPALQAVRVMGMAWTGTIITGLQGGARLALMRWWTTTGADASKMREPEEEGLRVLMRKWGPLLTFVFDRASASGPWLEVLQR